MRNRIAELIESAALSDPNTVFLTGDLGFSVVESLCAQLGPRFINAGVSEANMATMAGGLALSGYRTYIYSIAPFVTLRCLEQIRNDVCYQGLDVRIVGIGAGFSYGTLGPSHHTLEDATLLAALPGMTVLCPAGVGELDAIFAAYANVREPIYFRIGRERGPDLSPPPLTRYAPAWIVKEGSDATILCSGAVLEKGLEAARELTYLGVAARVVSIPVMHPFPVEAVKPLVTGPLVTVAEAYPGNPLECGAMRMLLEAGMSQGYAAINVRQEFPKTVYSHDPLRTQGGLSAAAIVEAVTKLGERK